MASHNAVPDVLVAAFQGTCYTKGCNWKGPERRIDFAHYPDQQASVRAESLAWEDCEEHEEQAKTE